MKVARTFTIDHELALKLTKEPNQASLVNELLHKHYNAYENMSLEELKKERAKIVLEDEYNKKLAELEVNNDKRKS